MSQDTGPHRWGPPVLCLMLLAFALANALRVIPGSDWPWLYDACRDLGMAQVILEGRYPQDNLYPEIALWFNPMTGALIALGSLLSDIDPPRVSVLLGPWLNLLPALLFFLLARRWCGRWGAAAALAGYLLLNANALPTASATYTPWLFAGHLAVAPFCAALWAFAVARATPGYRFILLSGVLHGLTFLTHTGAAVVLGSIFCAVTLLNLIAPAGVPRRKSLQALCIVLLTAFLTSLPYGGVLLFHHRLAVINIFPAINIEQPMHLAALRQHLLASISLYNLVALIGFVGLLRSPRQPDQRRLTLAWGGVLLFWLAQGYLHQLQLPSISLVPAHHFHAALTLFRALCFGAGAVLLLTLLSRQLARLPLTAHAPRLRLALCCLVVLIGFLPSILHYLSWEEFRLNARQRAPYQGMWEQRGKVSAWLRENARPEEVTLCDDVLAVIAVGATGRGAAATMLIFSSPYVDAARRLTDRDMMFEALRAKDPKLFTSLAKQYKVRYILAAGAEERLVRAAGFPFVSVILDEAPLTLYRVALP